MDGEKRHKTEKHHIPFGLLNLYIAVAILELILWHKYEIGKKAEKGHSPIDQAPLLIITKNKQSMER